MKKNVLFTAFALVLTGCGQPYEPPSLASVVHNDTMSYCNSNVKNPEQNPEKLDSCYNKHFGKIYKKRSQEKALSADAGALCGSWYARQASIDMVYVDEEVKRRGLDCAAMVQNMQMMQNQANIAYIQSLQSQPAQQPVQPYYVNRPIPQNNNVNCTSYAMGNQVHTNCY